MPGLTFKPEIDFQALIDMAKEGGMEALRPAAVTVSAPYASAMEFGTMPARNKAPVQARTFRMKNGSTFTRNVSDTFWNIYQWAERHATKIEPYELASIVYDKVVIEGLAPHPYVRPALAEFEQRFDEILKDRKSIIGCAEELAEMIRRNIDSGIPGKTPVNDTGVLRDSIKADYDDGPETPDYPDKSVWDTPDGDIHGNPRGRA